MKEFAMKLQIQMAREEEEVAALCKKIYVCPYCQKEFRNGKVYGGHKRSHTMKNKNKGHFQNKIQISNSKNYEEAVEDLVADDNKCTLGDHKKFPNSDKSLHGHMRKDSERAWRGMKHPLALHETNSLSNLSLDFAEKIDEQIDSDDVGEGFVLDLSKALPGWSKTGKRGRKGKGPMRGTHVVKEQTMSDNGVSNLLALADADPTKHSLPPKKRLMEFSPSRKMVGINGSYSNQDNGKGKALATVLSGGHEENDIQTQITSHKHVCSICNRSFKSYQALGGHKAHHGRKYDSSPSIDDESSSAEDDVLALYEEQPLTPQRQCPFCSKTFLKGQALGGHKRHCKGITQVNEASPIEVKKNNLCQIFSFDLNEPPPIEYEELKEGGVAMGAQDSMSLPWHEDGAEHDSYSSNTPSS